jgi:kynureninase
MPVAGVSSVKTEKHCAQLDSTDPLKDVRDRFDMPGDELIYLDGNSLGPLPRGVSERVKHVIEKQWGRDLIRR